MNRTQKISMHISSELIPLIERHPICAEYVQGVRSSGRPDNKQKTMKCFQNVFWWFHAGSNCGPSAEEADVIKTS